MAALTALLLLLLVTHPRGERAPTLPPYTCSYVRWEGASPGAGFTATALHVVEGDLRTRRVRIFRRTARHPDPMLPYEPAAIRALIDAQPWQSLDDARAAELAQALSSWTATKPPAVYNSPRGLGTEDGYLEMLTVTLRDTLITTRINPRGGYRPDDPTHPPAAWTELLQTLHRLPAG